MKNNEKMLYSVKEVAEIIQTNVAYVYALINNGKLPAMRLGSLKVRKATLERFLEECEACELADPINIKDAS